MGDAKYEVFLKTVEMGSLTKAAEALGYTQSGVTHILNALEEECGLKLLSRGRAGVRLTSDGTSLMPYFRELCNSRRKLEEQIAGLHGLTAGLVRMGTFTSISAHWLPDILRSFCAAYPNIRFELAHGDYDEVESWILQGQVDCGFVRMPSKEPLETIFLKRDRILAVLPENHALAPLDRVPLERLAEYPGVYYERNCAGGIREFLDACPIRLNIQFAAEDDQAIMGMVESGLGVSVMPELTLRRTPYKILQKELDPPAYRDLGIAFRAGAGLSPAAGRFIAHVKAWADF
ncbi:MAG TPA: LysR family transcriptional regulator [Peptococcaceae bacterium]|nr:LysR family transcriptional regulator [Peptococcaceae bacterium]